MKVPQKTKSDSACKLIIYIKKNTAAEKKKKSTQSLFYSINLFGLKIINYLTIIILNLTVVVYRNLKSKCLEESHKVNF